MSQLAVVIDAGHLSDPLLYRAAHRLSTRRPDRFPPEAAKGALAQRHFGRRALIFRAAALRRRAAGAGQNWRNFSPVAWLMPSARSCGLKTKFLFFIGGDPS
jgi:hypothetical protein